ncbi:hypothetical protein JL721_12298 [Aureococcus anophagefferens]|nr:hypothetical protein JL721_12298 [Aureococcus anophagefferens]
MFADVHPKARRDKQRYGVASLLYVVANHAIRLQRVFALAPSELEDQIGRVYGTLSSPAYYLYLFFLGFGLPLISSDRLRFQVLLVAVNLALSVVVVAAAGADPTRIALPMAFYMLSIVLSNAVIYMVFAFEEASTSTHRR